jgi:chromosome partitioning protein
MPRMLNKDPLHHGAAGGDRDRVRRVAVINQKGGVGKTTTSVNLAGAIAEQGASVLLIDVDCQGDLSSIFLNDHESLTLTIADLFTDAGIGAADIIRPTRFPNIGIVPADRRLNAVDATHDFLSSPYLTAIGDVLREVEGKYDYAIMDCAPRSHLSAFAALVAADLVLVPVEVENFAVRSIAVIEDDVAIARRFNPNLQLKYFLSKVATSSKTQQHCRTVLTDALGETNVFKTAVPMMATYRTAINIRKPVTVAKGKTKAAYVIRQFATEVQASVSAFACPALMEAFA